MLEKLPIVGGLVNCCAADFTTAAKEVLSTLLIALSPIWLGTLFLFIRANEKRDYIDILIDSVRNGELMLYCTALLAPVFYITSSDKYSIGVFPNKLSSNITAIIILLITTAVYTMQRIGSSYNNNLMLKLSAILFFVSLIILFVNKVYNYSKLDTYMDISQQEEKNFSAQLNQRRQ